MIHGEERKRIDDRK